MQPNGSTTVWWLLGTVGAVLGAFYGWQAAERYGPPLVAALGLALIVGGAAGWLFREGADLNETPHARIAVAALASMVLVTTIAIAVGADSMAVSLFALLALVGGIGVAIHPKLALGAALAGIVIGGLDAAIPWVRPDSVSSVQDGIVLAFKAAAAFGLFAPAALAMNEKRASHS
jgi:hypothetical protein